MQKRSLALLQMQRKNLRKLAARMQQANQVPSQKRKRKARKRVQKMPDKLLKMYTIDSDSVRVKVSIGQKEGDFVRNYLVDIPEYGKGTEALLDSLKKSLVYDSSLKIERMLDQKFVEEVKERFSEKALKILDKEVPQLSAEERGALVGILVHEMLGLGKIEFLLADGQIEEIAINSAKEPIWIYHKEFGWLKTNITVNNEADIQNFASIVARRVGKQITILNPLLDAHLVTGDRANATLFPISSRGNTMTIRRFRRDPWTVTDLIENKTVNSDVMALIWLGIQYELNMIISGGTASGKTSFMGICMPFIQPNHRVLTIEDTRELMVPSFLHWVPLTTREPNPEGRGGISMLDLLINSLRMRPDRIIVGEIRRAEQAEVLFEAMHTGHSVYATLHADTAEQTYRRLVNPPINVPIALLEALHLNVVMFRDRRRGIRRLFQIAEIVPIPDIEKERATINVLYKWHPVHDKLVKLHESKRIVDELKLHTGMTDREF